MYFPVPNVLLTVPNVLLTVPKTLFTVPNVFKSNPSAESGGNPFFLADSKVYIDLVTFAFGEYTPHLKKYIDPVSLTRKLTSPLLITS
jgi:hypothetical protein